MTRVGGWNWYPSWMMLASFMVQFHGYKVTSPLLKPLFFSLRLKLHFNWYLLQFLFGVYLYMYLYIPTMAFIVSVILYRDERNGHYLRFYLYGCIVTIYLPCMMWMCRFLISLYINSLDMVMGQNPGTLGTVPEFGWLMEVYSSNMGIIGFDPSPYIYGISDLSENSAPPTSLITGNKFSKSSWTDPNRFTSLHSPCPPSFSFPHCIRRYPPYSWNIPMFLSQYIISQYIPIYPKKTSPWHSWYISQLISQLICLILSMTFGKNQLVTQQPAEEYEEHLGALSALNQARQKGLTCWCWICWIGKRAKRRMSSQCMYIYM